MVRMRNNKTVEICLQPDYALFCRRTMLFHPATWADRFVEIGCCSGKGAGNR
jgi:hypothetical protein